MLPVPVKSLCSLMLPALALSLTGCAAPSVSPPVAIQCPAPPPVPTISQPLPKESYSSRARLKFKSWQQQLTDTPAMSKP